MPFDRRVGEWRVVNAGSVGMLFAGPPGPYWLLLTDQVQLRRTDYDYEAMAALFRGTDFPHVEEMAVRYVLSPPTEEESLQLFAGAELRG